MNYTKVSKLISLILRHKPEALNLSLDEHGWANVNELIERIKDKYPFFTPEILEEIVSADCKQRYSFNEMHTKIRANYGHSIDVDIELKEVIPPDVLYHGTAAKCCDLIKAEGIKSQSRLYVHLSLSVDAASEVGKRHGKPIVFIIDAKRMYADGFKFFKPTNNVYLVKEVPCRYLVGVRN